MKQRSSRLGAWIFLIVLTMATVVSMLNYQHIYDWYVLRGYTPPPLIEEYATTTTMTPEAEKIFFVTRPEVNDKAAFNVNCPFKEETKVLGCYSAGRIYILDVDEPSIEAIESVTAAHEMLHAAYDRLSGSERDRVDRLLQDQLAQINDSRLDKTLDSYRASNPDSIPTELHSIIGTEVTELDPELEEYYSQYFSDRQTVVVLYQSYQTVFDEINDEIDRLQAETAALREQIEQLDDSLSVQRTEIDAINARLSSLRDAGDIAAYNALIPEQNAAVRSYNSTVATYQSTVEKHNQLVRQVNGIVLTQNQLVNSIDSNFQEL